MRIATLRWLSALALLVLSLPRFASAAEPDQVPGLEAWYKIESLHLKTRDGEVVPVWHDSSGHGHDLVDEKNGLPATFRTRQANGRPVVVIGKANTHAVTVPFDLHDHTIVLVLGGDRAARGLFADASDPARGLVLRAGGSWNQYQYGAAEPGKVFRYGSCAPAGAAFHVTVLGREAGVLRSFVDGAEASAAQRFTEPVRVGRLFRVAHTKFVDSDGEGLKIAEMAFYGRWLTDSERESVTRHLTEKYGIELRQATPAAAPPAVPVPPREPGVIRLRLSTDATLDLNGAAVPIPWTLEQQVDAPFRHGHEAERTRIHCTRDGVRARLAVSLPLRSAAPAARLRLLVLKNGTTYLPAEATSGPFSGEGESTATVRLEVELALGAADYLEVLTARSGSEGRVGLGTGPATLVIEELGAGP